MSDDGALQSADLTPAERAAGRPYAPSVDNTTLHGGTHYREMRPQQTTPTPTMGWKKAYTELSTVEQREVSQLRNDCLDTDFDSSAFARSRHHELPRPE